MQRFKFRLETVLRHRETIESLREQDFAQAQGVVHAIEARITHLREEFRRIVLSRPGGSSGEPFDARSIYDRERYLETLQAAIAQQERALEAAQIVLEETRRALVAARQAREAVSHLRERDLLAHTALSNKIEQDTLDELATLRHTHASQQSSAENLKSKIQNCDQEAA